MRHFSSIPTTDPPNVQSRRSKTSVSSGGVEPSSIHHCRIGSRRRKEGIFCKPFLFHVIILVRCSTAAKTRWLFIPIPPSPSFLALILPAARGCNFHTEQNTNWGRKMCCSPEKIGGHCRRSTESPDRVIILITAAEVGAKQGVDHSWVSSEATAFHGRSFVRAMQPPL